jgi:hypothetical protein
MASTTRDKIHLASLCGDRRREFNTLAHARNGGTATWVLAPQQQRLSSFCMRTSPQQCKLFLSTRGVVEKVRKQIKTVD